jgi:hypothetical protein
LPTTKHYSAETFEQEVVLAVERDGREISAVRQRVSVGGYEAKVVPFEVTLPANAGDYLMKAEITVNGEKVFSLRDIPVKKTLLTINKLDMV